MSPYASGLFKKAWGRLRGYGWLFELPLMLGCAALAGVAAALTTQLFYEGIYLVQHLVAGRSGSISATMQSLPWYGRLLLPAVGGLAAGALLWWAEKGRSRTNSDYMEAVAIGDGRLSVRQGLVRSLSSLLTVSTGGSIGREGAMVHLGGLSASVLGRWARFDTPRLRLLVACGAAAGVASAYGAPIAGALFVAEIVLGSMAIRSVGPLLIAAACANVTMRALGHYHVTYRVPDLLHPEGLDILPFVLLGILAGVVAPQFLRLLDYARRLFARTGLALPLRLGLGGLLLGLLLIAVPTVAGNGFNVVTSLLHQPWAWHGVVLILLCKVLSTSLTVGSGAVGGVFTPMLFVGAAFGTLFGQGMLALWPGLSATPQLFALVGMGAFLSAATGAPLMAILMLFEMTLSYQLVLPLMLACVVAYFAARGIAQVAMYDVTLAQERNLVLRYGLRRMRLQELVKPAGTVLPDTAPIKEALQMFLEYPVRYLYVVNEQGVYQGVVAQQDLTSLLMGHGDLQHRLVGDVVRRDFIKGLHPDIGLDEAQAIFVEYTGERLPVVSRDAEPRLLGVVHKSALLEKYSALKRSLDASGETVGEAGWRPRPGPQDQP